MLCLPNKTSPIFRGKQTKRGITRCFGKGGYCHFHHRVQATRASASARHSKLVPENSLLAKRSKQSRAGVYREAEKHKSFKTAKMYDLVRACRPKLCQSRMPHAIATRTSHIWCHTDRHEQWKWVACPVFFHSGPTVGLTLVATCPRQPQAFKKVNNGQAFS